MMIDAAELDLSSIHKKDISLNVNSAKADFF